MDISHRLHKLYSNLQSTKQVKASCEILEVLTSLSSDNPKLVVAYNSCITDIQTITPDHPDYEYVKNKLRPFEAIQAKLNNFSSRLNLQEFPWR